MKALSSKWKPKRKAFALLLVLVIIVPIGFAGYALLERAVGARQISRGKAEICRRYLALESGVEIAKHYAEKRRVSRLPLEGSLPGFLAETNGSRDLLGYPVDILLPDRDHGNHAVSMGERFGLEDLSGRLNINCLPLEHDRRMEAWNRLKAIPGMTRETAEAILDWMDEDDIPSEFGAETDFYRMQESPVMPRQGRISRIEEVLAIRGVTKELLLGSESSVKPSPQDDRYRDDLPWCRYLTLRGAVSNLLPNGEPKINLNDNDLVRLYDALDRSLGPEIARFVVALRLVGTTEVQVEAQIRQNTQREPSTRQTAPQIARLRALSQLGQSQHSSLVNGNNSANQPRRTRGGLNLERNATYQIKSLLDLVETRVRIDIDHKEEVLVSPWRSTSENLAQELRRVDDIVAFTDGSTSNEKINIAVAGRPVLMTIPGMTSELAGQILECGDNHTEFYDTLRHMNKEELRKIRDIAAYVAFHGDVYKGVSVVSRGTPFAREMEFTIDSSRIPAILLESSERGPEH